MSYRESIVSYLERRGFSDRQIEDVRVQLCIQDYGDLCYLEPEKGDLNDLRPETKSKLTTLLKEEKDNLRRLQKNEELRGAKQFNEERAKEKVKG